MSPITLPRLVITALLTAASVGSLAADSAHDHSHHAATHVNADAMALSSRSQAITLPDVDVVRDDGQRMRFPQAIDDGRPVVLDFIYTSCTAICPVTSQVFMEFRELLGPTQRDSVNMVSVSIDPEQDTPRQLSKYAKRFGSAGTWAHYTGSTKDSETIQRAFNVWRGDKMNHQPVTFIRAAVGQPWIRIDGFLSPTDLLTQYRQQVPLPAGKK
ncbi:MAG: SCO family protein [Leptothrix ochracea]|uniref:SCO family protein n=1 Tax=Leptothrix ochracea TaxID=735331 RepID=UPI0034E2613E